MEYFPTLSLGPLPTMEKLDELTRQGIYILVNLSGRRLQDIYGAKVAGRFQMHDFDFEDVFSRPDLTEKQWQKFQRHQMTTLMQAVDRLGALLLADYSVHCFCHQGQSRSSLVAAGALVNTFDVKTETALDIVRAKNPRAKFSDKSRWFLNWVQFGDVRVSS